MDYGRAHSIRGYQCLPFVVIARLGDLGHAIPFNAESSYGKYRLRIHTKWTIFIKSI